MEENSYLAAIVRKMPIYLSTLCT